MVPAALVWTAGGASLYRPPAVAADNDGKRQCAQVKAVVVVYRDDGGLEK